MRFRQLDGVGNAFKFKFYLNSMHAVLFNDKSSAIHKHTWEVSLNLREKIVEFSEFNKIEKKINDYLTTFNDKVLNDIDPFTKLNPTMENMGFVFYEDINLLIDGSNYILETLEISENPTRTYIVNKIMNYKSMMSEEYRAIMIPLLNEMRGIKTEVIEEKEPIKISKGAITPNYTHAGDEIGGDLGKVLSHISRNFEEMNRMQELRRQKKKKAFRIKLLITTIILSGLGAAGYYFIYLKEMI